MHQNSRRAFFFIASWLAPWSWSVAAAGPDVLPLAPEVAHKGPSAPSPAPADDLRIDALDLEIKPIGRVTTDLTPPLEGGLPPDYAGPLFTAAGQFDGSAELAGGSGPLYSYHWQAAAICHRPLYFEDINLERLGYSHGLLQPVLSAAHFFGQVPLLPYKMTVDRPHRCIYTLGHYRPGSPAPYQFQWLPLRADAALVEAGVVTGVIFLLP
jgi:hypothetical protein